MGPRQCRSSQQPPGRLFALLLSKNRLSFYLRCSLTANPMIYRGYHYCTGPVSPPSQALSRSRSLSNSTLKFTGPPCGMGSKESHIFVTVKGATDSNSWHHPCQSTSPRQSPLSRSPCRYVELHPTDRSRNTQTMHLQPAEAPYNLTDQSQSQSGRCPSNRRFRC